MNHTTTIKRSIIKKTAKHVLKKHYMLLVVTLLFAAILGTGFTDSLSILNISSGQSNDTQEGTVTSVASLNAVIGAVAEDTLDEFEKLSENAAENIRNSGFRLGPLGIETSKGTIAAIITKIGSGSIYLMAYSAIRNITGSDSLSRIFFIVLSLLIYFAFWALIVKIYNVIYARIFLESRLYKNIPVSRFLFLFRVRRYFKAVCGMLLVSVFQILWNLTIIGGIIKHYSYLMVPFIIAENPDIRPIDAIRLSRSMMKGHKWEMFILDLSFIPWDLLNSLTFGLLGLFFLNPYKVSTTCEYYYELRNIYKQSGGFQEELLNDIYLYELAPDELLEDRYADVMAAANEPEIDIQFSSNVKRFFAKWFGVVLSYNNDEDRAFRANQIRRHQIERWDLIRNKLTYPTRLFTIPEKEKSESAEDLGSGRCYSLSSLILLFFTLCFVGWIWEVSLHLVKDGIFVNRGTMFGPWLPIYGAGSVMILVLLRRFREKPWLEFITAIILCGIVEYFSSYFLEIAHDGMKWWDYHGTFLNLNGRICAEGLLIFGLGGIAVVYLLAPFLDNLFRKIKRKVIIPILTVLILAFAADLVYSAIHPNAGKGITDYEESVSNASTNILT